MLRELGVAGQERLSRGRVLIVGAGGLGAPAAMYLAAAGVGTLGLADVDVVEESNLHRQLLYGMHDIGTDKLTAAEQRLNDINPLVQVQLHHARITDSNAFEIISGYDIVLDGTDNFAARYAINDACVKAGVPFVYGSVARFEGQVSVFATPDGPCYRCLFPQEPLAGTVPNCAEDGVLGILPGIVGLHQSAEVIKWLAGLGRPLAGRLLMLDLLEHSTQEILIARDAACRTCGAANGLPNSTVGANPGVAARSAAPRSAAPRTAASRSGPPSSVAPPGAAATPINTNSMPAAAPEVSVTEVAERLRAGDEFVLLDVREPWEFEMAQLPNAQLVPLSTLPAAHASLDPEREYVVYCHHGMRSAMAANWLMSNGFGRVANMTGGIDAWSMNVDGTVPQY